MSGRDSQPTALPNDLRVSLERSTFPESGVPVRAIGPDGKWGSHDIAHLDRDSLHQWLRSRGGKNLWAENVVFILLNHNMISADDDRE